MGVLSYDYSDRILGGAAAMSAGNSIFCRRAQVGILQYAVLAYCLTALALGSGWARAADLEITVHPDLSRLGSDEVRCPAIPVPRCAAGLSEAFALIQRPEWQQALDGNFSSVRLRLAAGTYRLAAPLSLRWGEGPTSNVAVEISGVGPRTVLSGATLVSEWSAVEAHDVLTRIAPSARNSVRVAAVSGLGLPLASSASARGFGLPISPTLTEVFYRDAPQPLASWPNRGYGRIVRSPELPATDKTTFAVAGREIGDWQGEPDLQVFGFWFWDWAGQTYGVARRDAAANVMKIDGAGSPYGIKDGQRLRVENSLTELDMPGEWYLDRSHARLYFWPPDTLNKADVEIAVATSLLIFESSRNVAVRDLVFEKTRGDAVVVKQSSDVVLDRVTIRETGNRALVVEGGLRCGVRNSLIEDTGEGAVSLSGGNRQTLEPAHHFAQANVIRRFSRLAKTYRFAVQVAGVGQVVEGNTISDAPHTAVWFGGNDHRIAGNEIFDVVKETSDAGAIYTGRDFTARGTVIEENFLHDIRAADATREVKGIYLDDQASGIVVRHNLFARVQQAVFIGGGRDNIVDGNIFYESSPAIHLDARGMTWQKKATQDPKLELQSGLDAVPYLGATYASRYANLSRIRQDDIGAPKYNRARGNVVVKGIAYSVEKAAEAGIDLGGLAEQTEDVFVTPAPIGGRRRREDFRLRNESLILLLQ